MTAAQMDLVEFLQARLDEEAATAEKIKTYLAAGGSTLHFSVYETTPEGELRRDLAVYNPTRLLHDVEAKRRIVDAYIRSKDLAEGMGQVAMYAVVKALENMLRLLAAIDANHPDYDERWRP